MHAIDLPAYFRRIGYNGPIEPTLDTLRALHLAHVTAIPFENLNPWGRLPVSLALADIEQKLVHSQRGGYCFEQNSLFAAVLRQLGYDVTPMIARVRWMLPPEVRTGLTHMILRVEIHGRPWLADVGFGGVGLTAPIALDTAGAQSTPHETRRIHRENGTLTHQVQLSPERWEEVYVFDLQEAFPIDFEIANWFTSTHPESIFRKNLIVTLPLSDHRISIAAGEFTRRWPGGVIEKRTITDDADLHHLLIHSFGLPAEDPAVSTALLHFSSPDGA